MLYNTVCRPCRSVIILVGTYLWWYMLACMQHFKLANRNWVQFQFPFVFIFDWVNCTEICICKNHFFLAACGFIPSFINDSIEFPVPRSASYRYPSEFLRNKSRQDALFYCQCISVINLYMFRTGLLLIIRRFHSEPANSQSTWTHDTYQMLYIQKSTSWWWAVNLFETCRG